VVIAAPSNPSSDALLALQLLVVDDHDVVHGEQLGVDHYRVVDCERRFLARGIAGTLPLTHVGPAWPT